MNSTAYIQTLASHLLPYRRRHKGLIFQQVLQRLHIFPCHRLPLSCFGARIILHFVESFCGWVASFCMEVTPLAFGWQGGAWGGHVAQDNATCHVSGPSMAFLKKHRVKVLADWPPHSPDLSPVENLWSRLKDQVDATAPTTVADLERASKAAWRRLTSDKAYVAKLFDSMPNMLREVLRLQGGRTKY